MKRLLPAIIGALLCMTGALSAQDPAGGTANIAGTLYASNFAKWTAASGTNGPFSWSSPQVCTAANVGGVTFQPFKIGTPLQIVDTATPADSEIVTPSAVNINGSGCSITVTTTKQHYSFYIASATGGLQEAINYANGQPYVVVITSDFTRLGGTTSMIVNAKGNSAVSILDERNSVIVPYAWSSGTSTYVAQPFGQGGTPATPAYAVQFAGPGATAFNADATFSFNTSTHGLSAYLTNGGFNSDVAATGGGNNGIFNLLAGPCASGGCFFARPQTSTDTENISTALNSGATTYVHGQDGQYGLNQQYFKNVGLGSGNVREARRNTFFFNDSPANAYIKENGVVNYYTMATPGTYVVGSPMGSHMHDDEMWTFGRSISSLSGANIYAYHIGDAFDSYHYFHYRGGCVQGNDECVKGMDLQLIEEGAPFGAVTSGGHGATTVTLNYTGNAGNQGDGYYLLDTAQVIASGLFLSTTSVAYPALDTMTTSDTHAVSNAWATISATCGAQTPRNAPASATCSLSGITGTFSAAAGSTICIGDPGGPEQVAVTAVGSGTITANLAFSHPSGIPVYQGGACGGMAAPGFGNTVPGNTSEIHAYWVAGSKTSTSFDYLVAFKGGQQGNPAIVIPGLEPLSMTNLVRTANVVTAKVSSLGYAYNNLTPPFSSSLVISGATGFNGTITAPVVDSLNGTITFAQTGADATAPSAMLTLTNYNNYVMYAGAETVAPPPVTLAANSTPIVGNTLQIEANQGNWAPGDSFIQENSIAQNDAITDFVGSGYTYPLGQPDTAFNTTLSGAKWAGATYFNLRTNDAAGSFAGRGGFLLPRHVMNSTDYLDSLFTFAYAPMNGSYAFSFGCPLGGCTPTSQPYDLFRNQGNSGQGEFRFDPADSTFSMLNGFWDSTYVAGRTAIGIGGQAGSSGLPLVTPGTAGFGGYFTAIGDPTLSSSNDTLVLGNGKVGDSSGTLGVATAYIPTLHVGAKAPASFQVFSQGTTGSTTYNYSCSVTTANGTTLTTTGATNSGNATLSSSNYNVPKCYGVPGGSTIKIWRTSGGSLTPGYIGSVNNSDASNNIYFQDTGIVGDGTSPPAADTSGSLAVAGPVTATNGTFSGAVSAATGTITNLTVTSCTGCGGGSALPSGTTNQMLYYAAPGTTATPLTLGTNLSITSGTLNASATAATNFNALTSGTNTTAAMLVGAGASLAATGSGTIAATSAPYSGLTGSVPTWNQSTTGNAATASALAASPTLCSTGNAPTGILANGNATGCAAIGGNTTSTSLTTNTLPKANGANSIINSALSDDGTTATYAGTGGISAKSFTSTDTSHNTYFTGKQAAGGSDVLPTQASGFSYLAFLAATGWNEADGTGSFSPLTRAVDFVAGTGMSVAVSGKTVTFTASGSAPIFPWSCQPGLGDGLNAITAGTYLQTSCYNDTGHTVTLTGLKCYADAGSPTMNVTNGTGTGLLTGAITCSSSYAAGTQSATVTLAAGDYLKFTFVASGTAKQGTFVVTGTHP